MDTTTSLKMTSLAVQSLFSYVEEENLEAIKAHLDKFRDVDSRSDVSWALNIFIASNRTIRKYRKHSYLQKNQTQRKLDSFQFCRIRFNENDGLCASRV